MSSFLVRCFSGISSLFSAENPILVISLKGRINLDTDAKQFIDQFCPLFEEDQNCREVVVGVTP